MLEKEKMVIQCLMNENGECAFISKIESITQNEWGMALYFSGQKGHLLLSNGHYNYETQILANCQSNYFINRWPNTINQRTTGDNVDWDIEV